MMKQNATAVLGFFAVLVMALSIVSAISVPSSITLNEVYGTSNSTSFTLTNNEASNWTSVSVTSSNTALFTVSSYPTSLVSLNSTIITITASNALAVASYPGSVNVTYNNGSVESVLIPVTVNVLQNTTNTSTDDPHNLCGSSYNASMVSLTVSDDTLDNKNDWEWKPLDNIELKAQLRNEDSKKDYDYDMNLYLYDGNDEITSDVVDDTSNFELTSWSVDHSSRETDYMKFQVNGDVSEGNYDLFAVVQREDGQCFVKKLDHSVSINKESRQVVAKEVNAPTTIKAGETVSFDVKIANIGNDDEDKVKVVAYNSELGVDMFKEVDNLNAGDTATVTFLVNVPATANQGTYKIDFSTEYNYNDNSETYKTTSDSTDDLTYAVTVMGVTSAPTIGAKLISDAKVGKDLLINVSLTNNADTTATYDLLVEGASWAESTSFADSSVVVKAGETKNVVLTLLPKEAGAQDFTIKAVYGDEIKKQTVSVNVASSGVSFLSGIGTLGYLIGAVVILAILILIVAVVKLARPKRQRLESIAY